MPQHNSKLIGIIGRIFILTMGNVAIAYNGSSWIVQVKKKKKKSKGGTAASSDLAPTPSPDDAHEEENDLLETKAGFWSKEELANGRIVKVKRPITASAQPSPTPTPLPPPPYPSSAVPSLRTISPGGNCWYKNLTNEDVMSETLSISLTSPPDAVGQEPVFYRGQESLDKLATHEIRFGSVPQWRVFDNNNNNKTKRQQEGNGDAMASITTSPSNIHLRSAPRWKTMPEIPIPDANYIVRCGYEVIIIPGENNNPRSDRLVVLGGMWMESVQCCEILNYQDHNPGWTSFPSMSTARRGGKFAALRVREKLFVIGGKHHMGIESETFEVLDLNNLQGGWSVHPITNNPAPPRDMTAFRAVAVDHCIYVLTDYIIAGLPSHITDSTQRNGFYVYDTQSGEYGVKLGKKRSHAYDMTSITIPNDGTYVVVLGGCANFTEFERSVEAYHVESKRWVHVTDIPEQCSMRTGCLASTLGNRYILLAGGQWNIGEDNDSHVIAFDWVTKCWHELPSLSEYHYIFDEGSAVVFPYRNSLRHPVLDQS